VKIVFKSFCGAEDGVSAIEYALLGALIAVVIVVSVGAAGTELARLYTGIKDKIVLASQ
jgi:pilus assembly protein Flp/PilA